MIRSFLITGLRNILKNKFYSSISIAGLAVSTAASIFLGCVIYTELNFDNFHQHRSDIYRLTFDEAPSGRPGARHFAKASPPAGPEFKAAFPEIKDFVRLRYSDQDILSYEDKRFYEFGLFYADSSFFNVFSFELIEGDKRTALTLANSIVVSSKIARKYFGEEEAIGKVLKLNGGDDYTVTGVLAEVPTNSHIQFDILIPFHAFRVPFGYPVDLNSWSWPSFNTYFLLDQGASAAELEKKFIDYGKKNLPEEISKRFAFRLQPLSEIYFGELWAGEMKSGSKAFVTSLAIVAGILVLLSSLNFINLNSTRLLIRGKESAIRKVMGASKLSFFQQFVSESSILTLLGGLAGLAIITSYTDQLQNFFSIHHVSINSLLPQILAATILFCFLLGVVAGFYPALASARVEVAKASKGTMKSGKGAVRLRAGFILVQFVVTAALIGCVAFVNNQLAYIANKDLGFSKEGVIVLDAPADELTLKGETFRKELAELPSISGVGFSGTDLSGGNGNVPIYPEGNEFEEGYPMTIIGAKPGWLEALGIQAFAGKTLSDKVPLDSTELIINETAAKIFKWSSENAIGKRLRVSEIMEGTVVGVVKDFNMTSLHQEVSPLVILIPRTHLSKVYVKFEGDQFEGSLQGIERIWKSIFPDSPFYFSFLDDTIQKQYLKEKNFQRMLLSFSFIAIIIAVTGIYAFVAYVVKLKNKETALRKVLGSSQLGIYLNLVKPFVILVVVGNLIAVPLSINFMNNWLNDFAYRREIDPLIFVWILLGLLAIVLSTTFVPVFRALIVNPIKFLRED